MVALCSHQRCVLQLLLQLLDLTLLVQAGWQPCCCYTSGGRSCKAKQAAMTVRLYWKMMLTLSHPPSMALCLRQSTTPGTTLQLTPTMQQEGRACWSSRTVAWRGLTGPRGPGGPPAAEVCCLGSPSGVACHLLPSPHCLVSAALCIVLLSLYLLHAIWLHYNKVPVRLKLDGIRLPD